MLLKQFFDKSSSRNICHKVTLHFNQKRLLRQESEKAAGSLATNLFVNAIKKVYFHFVRKKDLNLLIETNFKVKTCLTPTSSNTLSSVTQVRANFSYHYREKE